MCFRPSAVSAAQAMYLRVKRLKQTIFLLCDPADTGADVKDKLTGLLEVPPESQRLLWDAQEGRIEVNPDTTLAAQSIPNDTVVFLTLKTGEDASGVSFCGRSPSSNGLR